MLRLLVSTTFALSLFTQVAAATCSEDRVELRGDWGSARFRVEIADDVRERSVGLMNRPEMGRFEGMLFVYQREERVNFWMENTLIPLDMIFADRTGTVQRVHSNAIPLDRTAIPGGDNIQFVLEINGGLAEEFGISEGTVLRHPAINPEVAALPCE